MQRTSALLLLGALSSLGISPRLAAAEVVTLQQLTQLALQRRPALAAGSANTRAARAELDQARSGYYPSLSLQAQSSVGPGRELVEIPGTGVFVQGARALDDDDGKSPFAVSVRNELDLELKGNLYDFGRTSAAVDAGRALHASAQAQEAAARTGVTQAVRGAYLAWLGQHALLGVAEENAAEAARRSERVQALIDEGARPQAELSVARTDELLAKLELERARGELRATKLALEQTVGAALSPTAEPDRALLEDTPRAPDSAAGPGEDPALRALALKQQAATAEARRLDRADAPLLAGVASAGVRTQDADHVFPAYGVGLSFSLPLLDGGGSDAAADAARARAAAVGAELQDERGRQLDARARAQLDHDNALTQLQTAQALLEVVQQRVREAEQAYELGASGLDALAEARGLLRRAQTEVVHAKLARASATLGLSGAGRNPP